MISPQLVVLYVDVELLGESVDRERGEVSGHRFDVGQVVAGLVEIATARQYYTPAGARPGQQRRREAPLRDRKASADVAPPAIPVGRVNADVNRLIGIGERS